MVRPFYFSGLVLLFSLTCITNAMSDGANPSVRNTGLQQPRAYSREHSTFSRQGQSSINQRAQGQRGSIQPVSNQIVKSIDSTHSRNIKQDVRSTNSRATNSNPITPIDRQKQTNQSTTNDSVTRRSPSIWGTLGALLVVISIILVSAKLLKKHHPMASANLPKEVIEVLGKRPLDARQAIHFVRCGSRILILGSSPAGLEMLSEVSDPIEVDLISGMCRERTQTRMMNSTFMNLFQSSQNKSDQDTENQAASPVRQSTRTEQESTANVPEREDYLDNDSAVTRLQQKLVHSSRPSLNDSEESGHV